MRRLLVLGALLSACSGEPESDARLPAPSPPDAPLALTAVPTFDMSSYRVGGGSVVDPTDVDAQERLFDEMREGMLPSMDLKRAMSSTTDWRAAEDAADRLVPQIPGPMRTDALRDAAHQLVYRLNSLPTLDPEAVDALAEHARSLAQLGSPEGDDILRALIRLEGRIGEDVRADIAGTAARHLGAAFTAQARCVGCTVEEALAAMRPRRRESMVPLLYDVQTVHDELTRIAGDTVPTP